MDQSEKYTLKDAMHWKCEEHSSLLNADLWSQLDLVPIKLVQLLSFLEDGIDLNDKCYWNEALAISLTIMHNLDTT